MGKMDGKVCILTGGGGSIGSTSALMLLEEGAKVMLVDRNTDDLIKTADTLSQFKEDLTYTRADVADTTDTKNYIIRTVEKWGKFDVLFCHAGVAGVIKPVTAYPDDVFDEVMSVNVRGPFLACKYGLPHMNNGGSIVITSSIMGVTADPGACAYAASKHAVIGLAKVVAKEAAGRGIRVNVLAPGPVDNQFQLKIEERLTEVVGENGTEVLNRMIPLGRHARPEEIAKMFLFLASDQSSFSTGSVFMVDGGMNV